MGIYSPYSTGFVSTQEGNKVCNVIVNHQTGDIFTKGYINTNTIYTGNAHALFNTQSPSSGDQFMNNYSNQLTIGNYLQRLGLNGAAYSVSQHGTGNENIIINSGGNSGQYLPNSNSMQAYDLTENGESSDISINPLGGSTSISNSFKVFDPSSPSSQDVFLGIQSQVTVGTYLSKLRFIDGTYAISQQASGFYGNESILMTAGAETSGVFSNNCTTIQSYYLEGAGTTLPLSINPLGGSASISNSFKVFEPSSPSSQDVFLGLQSQVNVGQYLSKLGFVDGSYSISQQASGFYGNESILMTAGSEASEPTSTNCTTIQSYYLVGDGSTLPLTINPLGGNVGINNGSIAPTCALDVHGTISATQILCNRNSGGRTTFASLSDQPSQLTFSILNKPDYLDPSLFVLISYSSYMTYNPVQQNGLTLDTQLARTVGTMMLWIGRFYDGMGYGGSYNINNKINGNASFNYAPDQYAIMGRPYWTEFFNTAEQLEGITGANGFLFGDSTHMEIYFSMPAGNGQIFSSIVTGEILNSAYLESQGIVCSLTSGQYNNKQNKHSNKQTLFN